MTDKVQKIREEVARIQLYTQSETLKQILSFIDSLEEEPVSEELEEALAREWQGYNDRGAAIVDALEDNTQELAFAKGFYRGAKWQKTKEKPVSEDLKEAIDTYLATYFGSEKEKQEWPFLKKMAIYFAEWQKQKDSIPISEELEEACEKFRWNIEESCYQNDNGTYTYSSDNIEEAFKAGAKWQKEKEYTCYEEAFEDGAKWKKEQLIANTADAVIGLPYANKDGGYTHLIDVSRPLPVGDNKIAIIFKEE